MRFIRWINRWIDNRWLVGWNIDGGMMDRRFKVSGWLDGWIMVAWLNDVMCYCDSGWIVHYRG